MPLSPNALAAEIMSAIKSKISKNNLNDTLPVVGHAIAKYLTRNTGIIYAWSGIMPAAPPVPDPVVMYNTDKVAGDINMYQTGALDPVTNGIILGKQITDGIKTFLITAAPGWTLTPGKFLTVVPIILPPTGTSDFTSHWLMWATIIITTYKTYINPTPLLGTHGSFLAPPGAGAMMTLIF